MEQSLDINNAQNKHIKTWVTMAEVAVSEVEKEMSLGLEGERNYEQDADIAAFSNLDEETVNKLMDI